MHENPKHKSNHGIKSAAEDQIEMVKNAFEISYDIDIMPIPPH